MAFSQILAALSIIVSEFRSITQYAANTNRLAVFNEAMDELEEESEPGRKRIGTVTESRLAMRDLTLMTPKYERRRYAILDEATSALDVTTEQRLYGLIKESGITFVSVGHRPSLLNFHTNVLELLGDGRWRIMTVADYTAQI